MTRTLRACWTLSVVLLWGGCDAKPPVGGPAAATPPTPTLVALAPVSDVKAKSFGEAITRAVQAENGSDDLIDYDRMVDRAATKLDVKPQSLAEFKVGVKKSLGVSGLLQQIRPLVKQGASYKHLRTHQSAEGTRVTMRLILPAGGVNYHDYLIQELNGHVNAVDVNIAAVGDDMSQTFRRLMIPLFAHENRGIMDRLSGTESLVVKHLDEIGKATKSFQAGQHQQVLQILNALPIELQNEKFVLVMQIAAAQGVGDEAATQPVVERFLAQYPSDPATALFSIDYYYTKKEFPKAIQAIRQLDQSVGGDAHLSCLLASLLLESRDISGAKVAVEKAITTEPELQVSYWTRVSIALAEEDNATLLKTLQYIHDDLLVTLSAESIRSDPSYAKFILSPEFKELEKWLEE